MRLPSQRSEPPPEASWHRGVGSPELPANSAAWGFSYRNFAQILDRTVCRVMPSETVELVDSEVCISLDWHWSTTITHSDSWLVCVYEGVVH